MAKATAAITAGQSKSKEPSENGTASRPKSNTPSLTAMGFRHSAHPKKKFVLFNQEGKAVATLIDQALAEKWVSDHRKGAVRFAVDDPKPGGG